MKRRWIAATAGVVVLVSMAAIAAYVGGASAAGGPPSIAAGPASGFIPSHNANQSKPRGRVSLLLWHNGPVMHSTTVVPVFWGSSWGNSSFMGDKISGLDTLYANIGGTPYAASNTE